MEPLYSLTNISQRLNRIYQKVKDLDTRLKTLEMSKDSTKGKVNALSAEELR